MSAAQALLLAVKRDIAMALSVVVTIVILVGGVSYIAGYQSAKSEMRASYCHVFGNDPRCKAN